MGPSPGRALNSAAPAGAENSDEEPSAGQMDAKAHERHQQVTLRNKKREMMDQLCMMLCVMFGKSQEMESAVRRRVDLRLFYPVVLSRCNSGSNCYIPHFSQQLIAIRPSPSFLT